MIIIMTDGESYNREVDRCLIKYFTYYFVKVVFPFRVQWFFWFMELCNNGLFAEANCVDTSHICFV